MQHMIDIGPQYRGDSRFAARMRFHQSWYRARVLGLPCGTGPKPTDRNAYGNMLARADGERGANFLAPAIFATAVRRLQQRTGAVERFRLLCNMLSSQPMCFNLFGPLVEDLGLATQCLRALLGDREVREVTQVLIEWAPQPRGEYLDDATAFDAFVAYVRSDGRQGFVGIETKLSESFSQGVYRKPAYYRWVNRPDSPFLPQSVERLAEVRHNQLWRDHLLAIALCDHDKSPYAGGVFALVRHPADDECAAAVAGYRGLLKPDDRSFVDLPIDRLIDAWDSVAVDEETRRWLAAFRLRYLDLAASEAEWQAYLASR